MIGEEESLDDDRCDEYAYIKDGDDLCAYAFLMFNVRPVLNLLHFKKDSKVLGKKN